MLRAACRSLRQAACDYRCTGAWAPPSAACTISWWMPNQLKPTLSTLAQAQEPRPRLAIRLNDNLENRIVKISQRFAALEQQLQGGDSGPQLSSNQLQEAMKEYKRLLPVGSKYSEFQKLRQELADVRSLVPGADGAAGSPSNSEASASDAEFRLLAEEEARLLSARLQEVEQELLLSLLPSAQDEQMGAIVEVRAGTGGDEAALFAADLIRMYQRYAEHKGWQCEVLEQSSSDFGGCKFGSAAFTGPGAFSRLRYEAGVHRVQRVPETEREGRIHTSTASIVVLPDADEADFVVREEDLRMDTFRSSGAGGQSVNTTNSAVRITHLPSGIAVTCMDERSQQRNRLKAIRVLRARLLQAERQKQESLVSAERRASIGSGDRHERIRTYNFPQDRVTDHRVGVTLHGLKELLSGESGGAQAAVLDTIIDVLAVQEQTRKLEELSEASA